jgi:CDP-diacylglycerol--glycerol-3-phosphate 3-phosphatidyltransferase
MAKHQFFEDIRKFPNLLCLYRLVAIVVSVTFFLCGYPVIGSTLGLTAGLTDYWDGIYARKHNMVTKLGALLDTVADLLFNFFVISAAVVMDVWPIWVLYLWGFRDLVVLAMRASAGQLGFVIPSNYLGKLASNFIFYAMFLMPLVWALTSSEYRYADFVQAHFHPMFCEGMWWFTFISLLIGIAMQWKAAYDYAKVYIHKYDEVHRAQKENAENENIESTDDFKAEV